MTHDETISLLEMMIAAYPNTKIANAADTVRAWELSFSEDPAEQIYKAARVHMNTCKFFPTPADIRKNVNRGSILYGDAREQLKIPSESVKEFDENTDESFCPLCGLCDGKRGEFYCKDIP